MQLGTANTATNSLNIDITPFSLWLELNKAELSDRFYVPPLRRPATQTPLAITDLIEDDYFEEIINEYGEESKDQLSTWSEKDLALAYSEARFRAEKIHVPITAYAEIN